MLQAKDALKMTMSVDKVTEEELEFMIKTQVSQGRTSFELVNENMYPFAFKSGEKLEQIIKYLEAHGYKVIIEMKTINYEEQKILWWISRPAVSRDYRVYTVDWSGK